MRSIELQIDLGDLDTGECLQAKVEIILVGSAAVTAIHCSRPVSPLEEKTIHLLIERALEQITGRGASTQGSAHFTDERELQKAMRLHLGGGQG
jgi:hypothetical protein